MSCPLSSPLQLGYTECDTRALTCCPSQSQPPNHMPVNCQHMGCSVLWRWITGNHFPILARALNSHSLAGGLAAAFAATTFNLHGLVRVWLRDLMVPMRCCFTSQSFTPSTRTKVPSIWMKSLGNPTRAQWANCLQDAENSYGDWLRAGSSQWAVTDMQPLHGSLHNSSLVPRWHPHMLLQLGYSVGCQQQNSK
jgi:hypothetical protein